MATPEGAITTGGDSTLPLAIGSLQEVTIEKLVYGGDGLTHIGSQAIFIPFAAVGDRLLVRITQLARNYARGVIERMITPSASRRTPPCQYFGVCGGCQLQHLDYEAQLQTKREFLHESLRRIGSIEWPGEIELRAAAEFGYRSRAEVKIERAATGETRIGYYQAGTHEVCEIESCPLLLPAANRELQRLHTEKSLLPKDATRIYLTAGDDGVIVTPATGEGARVAEYDALGTAHQVIAGMSYEFGVRSFFQVNRLLVEELVEAAVGGAHGRTAFDLYAGVGLFSLQLSRHFNQVHAIEGNHLAAAHGLRNLRVNGVGNVRYEATSVEAWLKHKASSITPPDFVILDPPRAGAGRVVIERLEMLSPRLISYVSCDPATLARDLRLLIDRGYALRSLVALDMFPQTFHLESVARLEKL